MKTPAGFTFQRTGRDGGRVRLGRRRVAVIRRLELVDFRPVAGAPAVVGTDVGVPLYWRQYANHQDPERRLNSHSRLEVLRSGHAGLVLRATGATRSRGALSTYEVAFGVARDGTVVVEVRARLEVPPRVGWRVTPQADHGELAFLTLWPAGVFSPTGAEPKRYQACLLQHGGRVEAVAHHHLESPDKQRLRLRPGDRFAWVTEDWNPVVTLREGDRAEAGVCAYMWDTHFGLRAGRGGAQTLGPGTVRTAAYALGVIGRAEARRLAEAARLRSPGRAAATPMYTGARHKFRATFASMTPATANTAWPWQREVTEGRAVDVDQRRDATVGRGDRCSLRIRHRRAARSCWQATTLGPSFGEPAFRSGGRLRLTGWVKVAGDAGSARLALRVHRAGRGNVFDSAAYEIYSCRASGSARGWRRLSVTTPPLRPAPDRVHLRLEFAGEGTAWFDDLVFIRLAR
ncbi:MAG: hypothetical protein JSR48_12850 [Verrucomicrobia bacterium]|nr:hypothetical protein [Verrucomicrobiota bacterium]